MTDYDLPKVIEIEVSSGAKGQPITVRNRNNGDRIHTTLGEATHAVVDLQNFPNGYTDGHVIDFMVSGETLAQGTLTTSGTAPQVILISATAISSSLTRGI